MIQEFLNKIFAPNVLQNTINELRKENAILRHEARHYQDFTYQQIVDDRVFDIGDKAMQTAYQANMHRRAADKFGRMMLDRGLIDFAVRPLYDRGETPPPGYPQKKLVARCLVRMPEPRSSDDWPCEQDPDWRIEEYALSLPKRERDRGYVQIILGKRLSVMEMLPSSEMSEVTMTRVAIVAFDEKTGAPYVVSR